MSNRAGASRDRGFAALVAVIALLALALGTAWTVPVLLRARAERLRAEERMRLKSIRDALEVSIQRNQVIPDVTHWVQQAATELGWNTGQVLQPFPGNQVGVIPPRLYLVDPSLASSLLPFTQSVAGLTGSLARLDSPTGRVMLISTTLRDVELPVSAATINAGSFSALWDWVDSPQHTPPSGWPASWSGLGASLHVERLRLPDLFCSVSQDGGMVSVNGSPLVDASGGRVIRCLRGGALQLADASGAVTVRHTVVRDAQFHLPSQIHTQYLTGSRPPGITSRTALAYLSEAPPTASVLPNYDPDQDSAPGTVVKKGGSMLATLDSGKIWIWLTADGGFRVNGEVSLLLFSAMKDFRTDKGGIWDCFLLSVDPDGENRSLIASVSLGRNPWSKGGKTWISDSISFGRINQMIEPGRRLALALVDNERSQDDQWLAYGTTNFPAALTITP